ncbi:MAG: hypothetical protein CMD35_06920 [Flavobacteriales bacterium]|nr:hypothetical protein [Flavobacteriales bacterium]
MKVNLLIVLVVILTFKGYSQSCDNADFETGTLNSWLGYTGTCCGGGITNPGIVSGRHTVVNDPGNDPLSLDTISFIAPAGGLYSVRLGNDNVGAEAEKLTKSFLVTPENTAFTYQYALLLEDPSGHSQNEKPKFEVKLLDENMEIIPGPCGYYQVTAGPETDTWHQNGTIRFKDWATVGIDLTPYIGQVMTIEFSVEDCGLGGHFGYAYIDAKCGYLDVVVNGFCTGDNDSVYLTAPSGFDEYYWPVTGETTQTILMHYPQVGDSVFVEITNEAGCSSQILHVFEEVGDAVGGAVDGGVICAGETFTLRPDTFDIEWRYEWTSSESDQVIEDTVLIVSPTKTTEYYLQILNQNGCGDERARDTVIVEVDTSLVFDQVDLGPICKGDSAAIFTHGIEGDYTWELDGFSNLQSDDTVYVSPFQETGYVLTLNNASCEWEDEFMVEVFGGNSLPDTIDIYFCPNDAVNLNVSYGGYVGYDWDGNFGDSSYYTIVNPTDEQIVELILHTQPGCLDTIVYVLNESFYPVPNLTAVDDSICMGVAAVLDASGGNTYRWYSQSSGQLWGSSSRRYISLTESEWVWVIAENEYGCVDFSLRDSVYVFVNDSAVFDFQNDTTICLGEEVKIDPIGGAGTYSWTNSTGTLISSDTMVVDTPLLSTVYYLTITNDGCSYSDYMTVNVYNTVFDEPNEETYCENDASLSLVGPSGFSSYEWVNQNDYNNVLAISNPSGDYEIVLALTTDINCPDTTYFNVREISLPTIDAGEDTTICYGDNYLLRAVSDYDGNDYVWTSNPSGFYSTNPNSYVSPTEKTTYTITYSNTINCSLTDPTATITVDVDASTLVDLGDNIEICLGDSVELVSSLGSGDFSWSSYPGALNFSSDSTISVQPQLNTNYQLEISNVQCSNEDFIYVMVNDTPNGLFVDNSIEVCEGQSFMISSTNPWSGSYVWELPDGSSRTESSPVIDPIQEGFYSLVVTDFNNCEGSDSIYVDVISYPTVDLGPDQIICDGESTVFGSSLQGEQFEWSTGETSPTINVSTAGNYSVEVSNGNCQSSDDIQLSVLPNPMLTEVPNFFTPNGDGFNDLFEIPIENVTSYSLKIYSRWGKLVFKTDDPNEHWDGKNGWFNASSGIYYYRLKFESTCTNGPRVKNGYVELARTR